MTKGAATAGNSSSIVVANAAAEAEWADGKDPVSGMGTAFGPSPCAWWVSGRCGRSRAITRLSPYVVMATLAVTETTESRAALLPLGPPRTASAPTPASARME